MKKVRFLGLDVHAETIAVAVAEVDGKFDRWESSPTARNRSENWSRSWGRLSNYELIMRRVRRDTSSSGNLRPWA